MSPRFHSFVYIYHVVDLCACVRSSSTWLVLLEKEKWVISKWIFLFHELKITLHVCITYILLAMSDNPTEVKKTEGKKKKKNSHSPRNYQLPGGVWRYGRAAMYRRRRAYLKSRPKIEPKSKKRIHYKIKPIGGDKNGGTRLIQTRKSVRLHIKLIMLCIYYEHHCSINGIQHKMYRESFVIVTLRSQWSWGKASLLVLYWSCWLEDIKENELYSWNSYRLVYCLSQVHNNAIYCIHWLNSRDLLSLDL